MDPRPSSLERAVSKISRVQGPHRILHQLRQMVIRNHRSMMVRCDTVEEIEWSRRVHTLLDNLVKEGDRILPKRPQPRKFTHRARKRGTKLALMLAFGLCLAGAAGAQDWSAPSAHVEDFLVRLVISGKEDGQAICTGVIVNESAGYVAAAAHCFPPDPVGSSIAANDHHAERVKVNHVLDVAVLQAKGLKGHAVKLREDHAAAGVPITLVGFGFGSHRLTRTFGWISDDRNNELIEARVLMDAQVLSGMSGGGIFDQSGDLVSVVGGVIGRLTPAGSMQLAYAPTPDVLRDFLKPFLPR